MGHVGRSLTLVLSTPPKKTKQTNKNKNKQNTQTNKNKAHVWGVSILSLPWDYSVLGHKLQIMVIVVLLW